MSPPPWGWAASAPSIPTPPGVINVFEGTALQPIIDSLTDGTIIQLGKGTFYGTLASPSTPLTIPAAAYGTVIIGQAQDETLIGSPILMQTGRLGLERLWVRADTFDYGVKIYNGGAFTARCHLDNVSIGALSKAAAQAGNGPRDGLILDGAGVFLAEKATIAFNRRHGLLVDSTGVDPNTTLKFDMCSFVQNGFGPSETDGCGIRLLGSCSIAEFNGGNCEGNMWREVWGVSMNNARFRDFDFETDQTMDEQVLFQTCNPVMFDNCNFFNNAAPGAARPITCQSCVGVHILPNRFAGWSNVGIIRIDEASRNCHVYPQVIVNDDCWVEDYSR